jgi:hypothetical protein
MMQRKRRAQVRPALYGSRPKGQHVFHSQCRHLYDQTVQNGHYNELGTRASSSPGPSFHTVSALSKAEAHVGARYKTVIDLERAQEQ